MKGFAAFCKSLLTVLTGKMPSKGLLVLAAFLSFHPIDSVHANECRRVFTNYRAVLTESIGKGGEDFSKADQIAAIINSAAPETRSLWISDLLGLHRSLPKDRERAEHSFKISPRRLADRVLALTVRGDLIISRNIQQGKSPIEAYATYLQIMTQGLNTPYGPREVMSVLQLMKKTLNSLAKQTEGDFLIIGGSLMNGRADLHRSDIDVTAWHASWVKAFQSDFFVPQVSQALESVGAKGKLSVGFNRMDDNFYGLLSPVAFKVTRQGIEMLLYRPPEVERASIYGLKLFGHEPFEVHSMTSLN